MDWSAAARKMGAQSWNEYRAHVAKRKEQTLLHHLKILGNEKSKKEPNKKLSTLVVSYLKTSGEKEEDLAEKVGVSRKAIHGYALGIYFPKAPTLRKLLEAMHLENETFEGPLKYRSNLAMKRGYESFSKYEKDLANIRKNRTTNQDLSRWISQYLESSGLSNAYLGGKVGVSGTSISNYRAGAVIPRKTTLVRLSNHIGKGRMPSSLCALINE